MSSHNERGCTLEVYGHQCCFNWCEAGTDVPYNDDEVHAPIDPIAWHLEFLDEREPRIAFSARFGNVRYDFPWRPTHVLPIRVSGTLHSLGRSDSRCPS